MQEGGKGVSNEKGFYEYTDHEARAWEEGFRDFSYDIRRLALRYPGDVVRQRLKAGNSKTKAIETR